MSIFPHKTSVKRESDTIWLITFADLATLLVCGFLLFSSVEQKGGSSHGSCGIKIAPLVPLAGSLTRSEVGEGKSGEGALVERVASCLKESGGEVSVQLCESGTAEGDKGAVAIAQLLKEKEPGVNVKAVLIGGKPCSNVKNVIEVLVTAHHELSA